MRVPGRGPAPLHPTQGLSSAASRRGQAAPPAAPDRPAAPPLGLQAGAAAPAPGGMAREPQAGTAPVAGGGPQTPGSVPQAPPTTARQQERLCAERPNHVWAGDFHFDETADRRRLKLLNVVDEYTREALATPVGR